MSDDYTSDRHTTGTVAVGGWATGEIESSGDRDWFAVTLEAGKTYRIDMKGYHTGGNTGAGTLFDPYLRGIYDKEANLLPGTSSNGGGLYRDSRVYFTATEDGTHYVAAGARGSHTGTYRLSVREFTDDFADGTETTGEVDVGGSATGNIAPAHDRDWFAVTLAAGTTYQIDLEGASTGAGTLSDPYLHGVHDRYGDLIPDTAVDDGGFHTNSRLSFTPTVAGTYYVAAGAEGGGTGTYTLSVKAVDDFAAGTGTAGTVAVGGSAIGRIERADDQDWVAVTLTAGANYQIDLEGVDSGRGTLSDPFLRGVHDAHGDLLPGTMADDGGVGWNSRMLFTAPETGRYYLAAGGYDEYEKGTYTLSVVEATGVSDDFAADLGTTGTVDAASSDWAEGKIDYPGDVDWFAASLEADRIYVVSLRGGLTTGAGTLDDPHLYGVHDGYGAFIPGTEHGDVNEYIPDSRLVFTPAHDGVYFIAAGADGGDTGTYALFVFEVDDDFTDDLATTGAVAVRGSATGSVDYWSDRDWFAVTLNAGTTYRIDLEGRFTESGTLGNPYLHGIHDAHGDLIPGTANNDGGAGLNSRVTFTPTETGIHYIAAAAGAIEGVDDVDGATADVDELGTYTLSVADVAGAVPDDYPADTGTSGAVAVDGSAYGEIEEYADRDWFAVTLQADKTYQIDLEGTWTGTGTLGDPFLAGIHDADGNFVPGTDNDDDGAGLNSGVVFRATEDATYYIAAGVSGSGLGTYRLSVREVVDDFEAGTGTAGAVQAGSSAMGEIEIAHDRDWFAVEFEAGMTYRIDLEGTRTSAGTLRNPYLYGVHDEHGDLISDTSDNNGGEGRNSRLVYTATAEGTHYIGAGGSRTQTGTYTLSVEDVVDGM